LIGVPCHCGEIIETNLETEIDLGSNPGIYKEITDGSFLSFTCPVCGNNIKTEISLHLFDKKNGVDLYFLPELERINYLSGRLSVSADRLAIGYKELSEKMVILGEKIDDRIIEIIKFQLLEKSDNKNIQIFLNHIDGDELIFYITGLQPERLGISKIPRRVYDQINSSLEMLLNDENIKLFTTPPYVSVNRIFLEE